MRRDGKPREARQVAICAADRGLRDRLEAALVLGGHNPAVCTETVAQLADPARMGDPGAIVLACALEPFTPVREITAVRAEFPEVPLVIVATGFLTSAA